MSLFEDIELFDEGKKRYKDFQLPGTDLQLWEQFFTKSESDQYFKALLNGTPWQQRTRKMYDKIVFDPRLTAYYGGVNGFEWTVDLITIKSKLEEKCGIIFDRVLLNYYRDGNDSVAWHSDTLPKDGKHHPIASITFGETRTFKVRHKLRKDIPPLDIPLTHGSFLLMGETMQDHYEHHVPKTTRGVGARINLTFRISEPGKKIYFASDFHLGTGSYVSVREREDRLVRWLDMIKADAAEIYLMGDVFDFWFEYATVVPKGYIRFLGKLSQLADAGIKITLFKGNHDMWMFDYFEKELGATIISNELEIERNGKKFFLHHGDGLGPGDAMYKVLKKVFRSKLSQWLFARLHPNFGVGIANYWSRKSRIAGETNEVRKSLEKEWLVTYSQEVLTHKFYDYLIFGHRHLPLDIQLNEKSRYINLGEWVNYNSYAVFDGEELTLRYFEPKAENS